ncbi:Beauvericin nonribosomal cyclodepsipeptide synthetase BEA1, partial [Dissostichus eleginoides]
MATRRAYETASNASTRKSMQSLHRTVFSNQQQRARSDVRDVNKQRQQQQQPFTETTEEEWTGRGSSQ